MAIKRYVPLILEAPKWSMEIGPQDNAMSRGSVIIDYFQGGDPKPFQTYVSQKDLAAKNPKLYSLIYPVLKKIKDENKLGMITQKYSLDTHDIVVDPSGRVKVYADSNGVEIKS